VSDGESAPPSSGQAELPPAGGNGERPLEEMSVGELVFEVSDRASLLIREEIELAKTEVTEKVNRILRGSVVGLVAGVFLVIALMLAMFGVAWFLNDEVFNNLWLGFFVEAGAFVLIAAGAGFYAFRAFKRGAPPTPEMAIEEAKEIKAAFDGGEEPS
jgi:putative superfamily III holin-X